MSPIRSVRGSSAVLCASKASLPLAAAEGTQIISDLVWVVEHEDKTPLIDNSTSQVPSVSQWQLQVEFIDDLKTKFMLLQAKKNQSTEKSVGENAKYTGRRVNKKCRPRNAFMLYRAVLQAHSGFKGKKQTELSCLISVYWKNESRKTKAQFERLAELESVFGYGAADIFGIPLGHYETDGSSYSVYHSRSAETQGDASLTADQHLCLPIYSGPNVIRLDETGREMSELLYNERHLKDETQPSYDQAMADPTPLMSTAIDKVENAMALALPDQFHPIENAISLQAMFAPSHTLSSPSVQWMDICYVNKSQVHWPQIYESTSHDHSGIIYPPNHDPLDSQGTLDGDYWALAFQNDFNGE